jgi:hypothetical protein
MEKNKELLDDNKEGTKYLVVIDDMIGSIYVDMKDDFCKKLIISGRHYGISLLMMAQYSKASISTPLFRSNVSNFFITKMNKTNIEIIYSTLCPPDIDKDEFMKAGQLLRQYDWLEFGIYSEHPILYKSDKVKKIVDDMFK